MASLSLCVSSRPLSAPSDSSLGQTAGRLLTQSHILPVPSTRQPGAPVAQCNGLSATHQIPTSTPSSSLNSVSVFSSGSSSAPRRNLPSALLASTPQVQRQHPGQCTGRRRSALCLSGTKNGQMAQGGSQLAQGRRQLAQGRRQLAQGRRQLTVRATSEVAVGGQVASGVQSEPQLLQSSYLGANLDTAGGCNFSVWAPHPESAELALIRNPSGNGAAAAGVEPELFAMTRHNGDIWKVHVPNVQAGSKYWFTFTLGGVKHVRRDARARATDYDSETCYVVDPRYDWTPFQGRAYSELNIYQLHVGAFTGKLKGGTFAALDEKLQHIADLGFTAVEMLPVHEYCGSWGYNPRLLFSIHPYYGTPDELRQLVDSAHKKGLAVIFDVVLNHGAARLNSLWAYDGKEEGGRGGIYFDGGTDTAWGRTFAWWQHEVKEMVVDAAKMFLSEYNGDGLRFDCVHAIPRDLCRQITHSLHKDFPDKILIAETTPEKPEVITGEGFDATWMHSSYYDMRAFMKERRSLKKLQSLLTLHPGYSQSTQCVKYFLGSHDQIGCRKNGGYDEEIQGHHRYVVELFGGRDKWDARAQARMWYSCQVLAQGIPMMFMGSEWHHSGWWGVDEHHSLNWDFQNDEFGQQMSAMVRTANRLRNDSTALQRGALDTTHYNDKCCVIGFVRKSEAQVLLAVVNASGSQWEQGEYGIEVRDHFPNDTPLQEIYNSQAEEFGGWAASGNASREVVVRDGKISINLPKWSALVFAAA